MAKISGELSQFMLAKRTWDTLDKAASGLITIAQGKNWGPRNLNLKSCEVLPLAPDQPCQVGS